MHAVGVEPTSKKPLYEGGAQPLGDACVIAGVRFERTYYTDYDSGVLPIHYPATNCKNFSNSSLTKSGFLLLFLFPESLIIYAVYPASFISFNLILSLF